MYIFDSVIKINPRCKMLNDITNQLAVSHLIEANCCLLPFISISNVFYISWHASCNYIDNNRQSCSDLHYRMSSWWCLHGSSTPFCLIMSAMVRPRLNIDSQLVLIKLTRQRPIKRRQRVRPAKINTIKTTNNYIICLLWVCPNPHAFLTI